MDALRGQGINIQQLREVMTKINEWISENAIWLMAGLLWINLMVYLFATRNTKLEDNRLQQEIDLLTEQLEDAERYRDTIRLLEYETIIKHKVKNEKEIRIIYAANPDELLLLGARLDSTIGRAIQDR